MGFKNFTSPREEALEIAYTTRKYLLNDTKDAVSLLRSCLAVATNLNRSEDEKWIKFELSGYKSKEVPSYRMINCYYEINNVVQAKPVKWNIYPPIQVMITQISRNATLRLTIDDKTIALVDPLRLELIISNIKDICLFYLNDVIKELQYGGIVEYLMEEIRNEVDEKLAKLDDNISKEASSLYLNLSSTNPADWPKVAHSCRRMLMFVADKVFPASNNDHTLKDGTVLKIGEPHIINRLCAFVDQELNGDRRKFLMADIKYFENYLRKVVEFTNMGEHNKTLEKFDANMIAIHNYLIIGDILKLVKLQEE